MSNANWQHNAIQFPRLIAELEAQGAFTQEAMEFLAESMDLTYEEIFELIDRACAEWDRAKAAVIPPL